MAKAEPETSSTTDTIACPHCLEDITDLWEHALRDERSIEIECGHCERKIRLKARYVMRYTATGLAPSPTAKWDEFANCWYEPDAKGPAISVSP